MLDDDDIARIARGVLDRTLPKTAWTHEAHFACALWLLRHRPDLDLPAAMPDIIRAYNAATGTVNGDASGYHDTITQASLRAARHVLHRYGGAPLSEVLAGLMASELGQSGWLLAFWTRERLFSVAARRGWVEPDLMPLSF